MKIRLAVLIVTLLLAAPAWSCGNYFGPRLLQDRDYELLHLIEAHFAPHVLLLAPPVEGLMWGDTLVFNDTRLTNVAPEREQLEARLLTSNQRAALARLRERAPLAPAPDDMPILNAMHPSALQYHRGVAAWQIDYFIAAHDAFDQARQEKSNPDRPWPLMAQFMVGRALLALADRAPDNDQAHALYGEAITAFEVTRERILSGEPDPLYLGQASLGEQAKAHNRRGEVAAMLQLYARQARVNPKSGISSLRLQIHHRIAEPEFLDQALAEPLGRDLVGMFAYSHFSSGGNRSPWQPYRTRPRFPGEERLDTAQIFKRIAAVYAATPPGDVELADRIAALMYRQGQYELAERFAQTRSTALTHWVQAKLALRKGDLDTSAEHLATARQLLERKAAAHGPLDDQFAASPICRISAEQGLLALARGELVDGFRLFVHAGAVYWHDISYLAERVLTADELIAVVDELPAQARPRARHRPEDSLYDEPNPASMRRPLNPLVTDLRMSLRHLLARRLLREQRFDQALAYFDHAPHRVRAETYINVLREAEELSGHARADRLFEAAELARWYGLRILAFESAPDWVIFDAQLAPYNGSNWREQRNPPDDARWINPAESTRMSLHTASPEPRFSHRYQAAELAAAAAEDVRDDPEQFARTLCHATSWLIDREPELARVYYHRYLQTGHELDWPHPFGRRCPPVQFGMVGINSATLETPEEIHRFFAAHEATILAGRDLPHKTRLFGALVETTQAEFRELRGQLGELHASLRDHPEVADQLEPSEQRQTIYDQIYEMTVAGRPWGDYSVAFEWPLEILKFEMDPEFLAPQDDPCSDYSMSQFVRSYIRTEPDGTSLGPYALMAIRLAEDFCRELRPERADSINWPIR